MEAVMEQLKGIERPEYASDKDFLSKLGIVSVDLEVPEMGGLKVKIKPLTIEERDKALTASKSVSGGIDNATFQSMTVIFGLERPKLTVEAIPALKAGNPKALDRIAKEIWKLSGLNETADAIKND